MHKQSVDGAFDAAEKPLDFGGERRLGFLEGLSILEEIPSNLPTENTEIPEICNKKESSNYLNNLSSTTDPLHCSTSRRRRTKSAQQTKRGEAAPVLLSHIVSAWRFRTWGIYTLVLDVASTYLGGVYQWSRWLMA